MEQITYKRRVALLADISGDSKMIALAIVFVAALIGRWLCKDYEAWRIRQENMADWRKFARR